MNNVDRERVATLVGEARKALGLLYQHRDEADTELLGSEVKLGNVKYQFIVAIESCIDICTHLAAKLYVRAPESYAGCFDLLREGKVIDGELAGQLSDLAKFRNLLVHRYWEVDDRRVVRKLKNDLVHLEEFLKKVSAFVGS